MNDIRLDSQTLDQARALDPSLYVDAHIAALDRAAVFARSWHLVAHVNQIPEPGDYLVADTALAPLLIVRDNQGELRAFHNVCRHRAGPLALCEGKGAKALRCIYHGWTYTLEGLLRSAPEMVPLAAFGLEQTRLHACRLAVWQGLIFVADATAPEFADFSAGWDEPLRSLSPERFQFHSRHHYDVDCHWKVYCDNYLEGYHVPHIHPGLNSVLDYRQYQTETGTWFSFQYSPLTSADQLYGSGDALYYFIYPNTMLNLLPGRLQVNRVVPLSASRCRVHFEYYYCIDDSAEATERRGADHEFSHQVQLEDVDICQLVQRGLESGSYVPGRLNPLRENAVHHFHELLRAAYRAHADTTKNQGN
jgi:choline monooxygenase